MPRYLNQLVAVTLLGLQTIPQRLGNSLVVVVGMACVVAVTISILSMSLGFVRVVNGTARADQAVVLNQGALYDFDSSIPRESVAAITDAPGIKRSSRDGKPIASVEFVTVVPLTRKNTGLDIYVDLRGIGAKFFELHPEVRLVSGRMFVPGKHELIVGTAAQQQFAGVALGDKLDLSGGDWTITGTFDSGGDMYASELLGDAESVVSAMRLNVFRSVWVQLQSPEAFSQFQKSLSGNPQLEVNAMTSVDFWQQMSKALASVLTIIAYVIGGIMGLGAVFAALNTMYAAVRARTLEIATLRAIGFDGRLVVASVLIEALALAFVGAAIGAAAAWIAFNGNAHVAGTVVMNLAVTPALLAHGILYACALGLIGAIFPAIRAAALPVTSALRAT